MESKTLIISPIKDGDSSRGIVTLYIEDDLLKCKIRLYNILKLTEHHRIGIYHQKQVYTANLLEKNGVYLSSFVGDFDMSQDFYVAIINTQNNNDVLLAGGTYGVYFSDYSVFSKQKNKQVEIEEIEECGQNVEYEPKRNCEDCDKCLHCKYKEFFYNSQKNDENSIINVKNEQKIQKIEENNACNVLNSLLPQFEYVFKNYNANEELNNLIKNSKFVKMEENGDEYSIGTIEENGEVKYICYAVKGFYNSAPPAEIGQHYQWLPLDREDPLTDGYFVVFQDAKDLKILEL